MPVKELGSYGFVEYGYGNWIRLVEKEGDYGHFMNLESGVTIAGPIDEETGHRVIDTKTKAWFKLPMDGTILTQVSDFLLKAADSMNRFEIPVSQPPELKASDEPSER